MERELEVREGFREVKRGEVCEGKRGRDEGGEVRRGRGEVGREM